MSWKEAQRVHLWQRHVMQTESGGGGRVRTPIVDCILKVFAHLAETLRSMILVAQNEGGSLRRLPGLRADIVSSF